MEILAILFLIGLGYAAKSALARAGTDYQKSKAQRVKEVTAKAGQKLPKSRRAAATRRHAAGYWAGELAHGFPVARTGWHAGWLAHRTAVDHHRAIREQARTDHLETRAAFIPSLREHRQRQAAAQKAIDEAIAAAPGPVTGRKAVQAAAGAVVLPFQRRGEGNPPPPVPPLPADGVDRRAWDAPEPARFRAPADVVAAPRDDARPDDSTWLGPSQRRCVLCDGRGAYMAGICPACRGWGSAPPDPNAPVAAAGTICTACGNPARPGDPVLADDGGPVHRSHAVEQEDAYLGAVAAHAYGRAGGEPDPGASRNPQPLGDGYPPLSEVLATQPAGHEECGLVAGDKVQNTATGETGTVTAGSTADYVRVVTPDGREIPWSHADTVWTEGGLVQAADGDQTITGHPVGGSSTTEGAPRVDHVVREEEATAGPLFPSPAASPSPTTNGAAPMATDDGYGATHGFVDSLRHADQQAAAATNGNGAAPMASRGSAEITYDQTIAAANKMAAEAEQEVHRLQGQQIGNMVDQLGNVLNDYGSLAALAEIHDALQAQKAAAQNVLDRSTAFAAQHQREHGGINEAVQSAPVPAAETPYYGG